MTSQQNLGSSSQPQERQPAAGIRTPRKLKPLYASIEEADAQPAEQPEIAQPSQTGSKLPPTHAARRVPASFGQVPANLGQAARQPTKGAFALPPSTPTGACLPKEGAQDAQPSQAASVGAARRLPKSFQDSVKAGPSSQNAPQAGPSRGCYQKAGWEPSVSCSLRPASSNS